MRATVVQTDAAGATRIEVVVCPKGTRDVDCTANISAAGRLCTISPNFFSRVRLYCVNARQLSIVLCKAGGVRRALSRAVRGRSKRMRAGLCRTGRKGNGRHGPRRRNRRAHPPKTPPAACRRKATDDSSGRGTRGDPPHAERAGGNADTGLIAPSATRWRRSP